MLCSKDYEEIVNLIYKIPIHADGWAIFSKKLSCILNASAIHILGIDFNADAYSYSSATAFIPDEDAASIEVNYLHHYVKSDMRLQSFLENADKGWYQCHKYISNQDIETSELYQNILAPSNIRYSAVHELILDDSLCVILSVNTSLEQGPLKTEQLNFLNKLLKHLKRICAIQRHIFEYSAKAIMGYALVDKLSQPIMLLNLDGKIIHLNLAAKELLDKYSLIKMQENQLFLPEPYQTGLDLNLQEIELSFKNRERMSEVFMDDGCIKIEDENGESLYTFATLLASEHEVRAFGIRPTVMLTLYHPSYTPAINTHLLNVAFNLTPAESKVALLLLDGFLAKEIAQKNKVNLDTVRKQLKSIFKKTATNRQSELVKLLLNMPHNYLNQ